MNEYQQIRAAALQIAAITLGSSLEPRKNGLKEDDKIPELLRNRALIMEKFILEAKPKYAGSSSSVGSADTLGI